MLPGATESGGIKVGAGGDESGGAVIVVSFEVVGVTV